MYNDDQPYFLLLSDKNVVAKKDYVCQVCKRPIVKGTRHKKMAFIDDDGFGYTREHVFHNWQEDS